MIQHIPYYERCAIRQYERLDLVVSPGIYDSDESLNQLIHRLSKKESRTSTIDYINLVVKYAVSYIFKNEKEQPISEALLRYFFTEVGRVVRARGSGHSDLLERNISLSGYQVAMVSDISKTVALIKDIIERKSSPDQSDGVYLGVDLGSGTGILLLAQYIQAKRNGFDDIRLHGIERSPMAANEANRLTLSLRVGEVHSGDTTNSKVFERYGILSRKINFISNENIPRAGIPFSGKNPEPQFANMQSLMGAFSYKALSMAQYFPHMLQWKSIKNDTDVFIGKGEDAYEITKAMQIEERNLGKPINNETPFFPGTITPTGISLGESGKIIPLEKIGEEYKTKSGVGGVHVIDGVTRW